MITKTDLARTTAPLLVLLLVAFAGCSSSEPVEEAAATEVEAAVDQAVEQAPAADMVVAKLALADLADGAADHVVGRCAACGLGMEGNPEYALEVHGYEMHFCSAGCKDGFAENPDEAILAMVISEEPSKPVEN